MVIVVAMAVVSPHLHLHLHLLVNKQPPPGGEMAGAGPSKRKCMFMRDFLAFHLHLHEQSFNHLFCSGKLFHEYLVDSWAICEQSHLNYLQSNQGKLHSDLYSALMTAVQDNPGVNPANMDPSIHLHWKHTQHADKLSGFPGSQLTLQGS